MASTPVTPQLPAVLAEVTETRVRQIAAGYTPEHDDRHTASELVTYAVIRVGMGARDRQRLVEAAAMLIAAVESIDRKAARRG